MLAALALGGLCALPAHAQLNYPTSGVTSIAGTYTDLGTNGTQILMQNAPSGSTDLEDDGLSDPENIGFNFQYEGQSYTQFVMCTNGFIKLGNILPSSEFLNGTGPNDIRTSALGSTSALDRNIIAPYNHDLTPGTQGTNEYRVFTSGTAPNRVCTIQWKDMADFPSPTIVFNSLDFQVKLYETTNVIEFVYNAPVLGTLVAAKDIAVGIKGTSNMPNEVVWLRKSSGTSWAAPLSIVNQNATNNTPAGTIYVNNAPVGGLGGGSSPQTGLRIQQNVAPTAGRTFRFTPVAPITDNASVIVYTLAKLAIPDGVPHVIRARVTNTTSGPIASRTVTLNVTGANAFSDTKPTGIIPAGGSVVVSFAAFSPTNTGTNTVTVTLPTDDTAGDNTSTFTQNVTSSELSYASTAPNAGGVGFTGAAGQFVARFTATSPRNIDQISVDFQAIASSQQYRLIIVDDNGAGGTPGTILYTSALLTRTTAAQTANFTVAPAVPVSGDFFVGVYQVNTTNIAFSYESEDPIRNASFYYRGSVPPAAFPAWNDFAAANSPFRFAVGVNFAPTTPPVTAPACASLQIPANNAVNVARTGTIQFGSGGGSPDGFDIYLSTNQTAVQTEQGSALVSVNQPGITFDYGTPTALLPSTVYYYKVVARNAAGAATGCATRSFTTAPGAPGNDNCANATTIGIGLAPAWGDINTPVFPGTTLGASEAVGSTDPTCSTGTIQDVWYSFTAGSVNGLYIAATMGTATHLGLEVYSACGGTSLACVSITAAQVATLGDPFIALPVTPGASYRLRVYTNIDQGAAGTFQVGVSLPSNFSVPGDIAAGNYNYGSDVLGTVTIGAASSLTFTGAMTINNLVVADGGTANLGASVQALNKVTVAAGATLGIGSSAGFGATGNNTGNITGAGVRAFSNDATYNYTYLLAKSTGTGLPSIVRGLGNTSGVLTLTNPVAVRRLVTLTSGNINANSSPGRLTLLSDAQNTAMVINGGAGVVIGTVKVQRWLSPALNSGLGYRHLSSPVSNTNFADLTTTAPFTSFVAQVNPAYNVPATRATLTAAQYPNIFQFDESAAGASGDFLEGYRSPNATTDPMTAGRGYAVYTRPTTFDLNGTLNNGTVNRTVTNSGPTGSGAGWNLVGNPYPGPIDWDLVPAASITAAGINASISVWKSSGPGNAGTYTQYVNGVGPANTDRIAMGQGFWVQRSSAGSGVFAFTNVMRVTSYANPTVNRQGESRPLVEISLGQAGQSAQMVDRAYVYFEQGATANGNDMFFDAQKLRPTGAIPTVATRANGELMGINGLPALTAATTVPVVAEVSVTGNYVLNAEQIMNIPAGMEVVLEDALTGTHQNLSVNPTYSFRAVAGDNTPRFTLHFRNGGVTGLSADQSLANNLSVYPNPVSGQPLRVALGGLTTERSVSVRMLNALGQVVSQQTVNVANAAASTEVSVQSLAPGMYTLQVRTNGRTATRQVVVQ
jgi:Secretion system C-terminal sorting domain